MSHMHAHMMGGTGGSSLCILRDNALVPQNFPLLPGLSNLTPCCALLPGPPPPARLPSVSSISGSRVHVEANAEHGAGRGVAHAPLREGVRERSAWNGFRLMHDYPLYSASGKKGPAQALVVAFPWCAHTVCHRSCEMCGIVGPVPFAARSVHSEERKEDPRASFNPWGSL